METQVKPGQVWQDKNLGRNWTVLLREEDGKWSLHSEDGRRSNVIPEWMLLDDYVLVKEAP